MAYRENKEQNGIFVRVLSFLNIYGLRFGLLVFVVWVHSVQNVQSQKIDRFDLVNRHNVNIEKFDSLQSLSLGNGSFAYTVDATGLQTFPEIYENGVCLGTQSDWGWHSFPNVENYRREETYRYFDVEGRKIPYAVQWNEPLKKKSAAEYFRANPHRLHLGIFGFELFNSHGEAVSSKDIKDIQQHLNLWEGQITSSFRVENTTLHVKTVCHPERDLIAVEVNSELPGKGLPGFKLRLPFPDGEFAGDGAGWNNDGKHRSVIIRQGKNSAVFVHSIDSASYFIQLKWKGKASLEEKQAHYFILKPDTINRNFQVTIEFAQKNEFAGTDDFERTAVLSKEAWKKYWTTGGAVDLSGTADPRAFELERRIILSQYVTRIQCAGDYPPQETGLTYNSWYGKPHLEMHWWHGVHWAYWNRTELLERSLDYYSAIFEKAQRKAEIQGYEGVRWPKMTDAEGNDSPSGVGEFLIWQEPHIIYFAELCYRQHPDKETLDKYAPLIFATADFMADFARYDKENNRYILGPPLIPAQENLEKEITFNPPFELAYWKWGLTKAQEWRQRMNLPKNEVWQTVLNNLAGFAQKEGKYLAAESAPDSYQNEDYYSDHPMVLGAFGMLPGTAGLDTTVMANTFNYIAKNWNWDRTWGWDYPMAAMTATRLGKPEQAMELLLKDVKKNTYLKNGHNYQSDRLRIYLPGNGGLLSAVAMMCAGFEGNTKSDPGLPGDWKVKWENLEPLF